MEGTFEVLGSQILNPSTTVTETTALVGQTLQVRAGSGITLEQVWAYNATGGFLRIRSPNLHDNTQGIRMRAPKANAGIILPYAVKEELQETETLIVETTGGASETDYVFSLLHYNQLPGQNANLYQWAQIEPEIEKIMGVEVAAKTGTVTKWGAPVAIDTSMNLFRAPARYAILGYQLSVEVGAVCVSGGGIGELRQGGPGVILPDLTNEWFVRLSEETGQAAIPVFSSMNVGAVNVELGGGTSELESKVTFLCAKLKN